MHHWWLCICWGISFFFFFFSSAILMVLSLTASLILQYSLRGGTPGLNEFEIIPFHPSGSSLSFSSACFIPSCNEAALWDHTDCHHRSNPCDASLFGCMCVCARMCVRVFFCVFECMCVVYVCAGTLENIPPLNCVLRVGFVKGKLFFDWGRLTGHPGCFSAESDAVHWVIFWGP